MLGAMIFLLSLQSKMADSDEREKLLKNVEDLNLDETNMNSDSGKVVQDDGVPVMWGFILADLYRLALKFYKDKQGKAVSLSYQDKLKLVAFSQQVSHGKFNAEKNPPLGVLDVIGRDRRDAWQALGDMDKQSAMSSFIHLLDKSCATFKPFAEAQKADIEMKRQQEILQLQREKEEAVREEERQERLKQEEVEKEVAEERKRQVQDALNAQTYHQFKDYAEQQYPGNPEQQAVLVRQLQEQHYLQYMQQLVQQQHQAVQTNASYGQLCDKAEQVEPMENGLDEEPQDGIPSISPPSMWTRKEIHEFKDSIRKEGGEAIIKVARGETVTVRVPTHEDGTCLFWEFATDSYDIGFGVFFEWTKSETNQVSVHIQDSDDDDDELLEEDDLDDEELSEYEGGPGDIESGAKQRKIALSALKDKPVTSAIVPVYRRECHAEVYAGSHVYPGHGVYLLKFDNSYSLWRSKTLYYRVYYTR